MTIWTTITKKCIGHYLSPIQLSALQQHGDPLDEIISDIIAWIRSEVQTNPHNNISDNPNLIPLELKTATCHLVIEALQSRIPSLKLSDDQIRNALNARRLLKRVASSEMAITPLNPENSGHITVVHSRPSLFMND